MFRRRNILRIPLTNENLNALATKHTFIYFGTLSLLQPFLVWYDYYGG